MIDAVDERFAVRTAVGVHGQRAVGPAGRAARDEGTARAWFAEAELLERERHGDREGFDDQRDIYVGRPYARGAEQAPARGPGATVALTERSGRGKEVGELHVDRRAELHR